MNMFNVFATCELKGKWEISKYVKLEIHDIYKCNPQISLSSHFANCRILQEKTTSTRDVTLMSNYTWQSTGIHGPRIHSHLEHTLLRDWSPRLVTSAHWCLQVQVKMIHGCSWLENTHTLNIGHFYTELECPEFNRPIGLWNTGTQL